MKHIFGLQSLLYKMANRISLRTETKGEVIWSGAPRDCMVHCQDGPVPASSLLLACLSPSLRGLLGARGEQEEPAHLSCPDLEAAHLSAFLGGLYAGGKDVSIPTGVHGFLFPMESDSVKMETHSPSQAQNVTDVTHGKSENVKEEMDYTDDYKVDDDLPDNSASEEETPSDNWLDEEPKKQAKKIKTPLGKMTKRMQSRVSHSIRSKFYCFVCDCPFRQLAAMENHVAKKHGPRPAPQCEVCNETFDTVSRLQYHKNKFHFDWVPCPDCGKQFPQNQLKDHIHIKHETCDAVTCEFCGSVFTNFRKYQLHINLHTRSAGAEINSTKNWIIKFKANCTCNLNLTSNRSRIEHYKRVHKNYVDCPKCQRLVKDLDEKAHRCEKLPPKTPDKSATCSICGKFFEKSTSLWYHMKSAHSEEPSECEICQKVFRSYVNMKDHMKIHSEKHTCVICGKQVARLEDHIQSVHVEESQKNCNCETCGKGFPNQRTLRDHMNIHLNLKPYTCREGCDMAYSDRSNRNQHERRVHGARGGMQREKSSANNTL